jgi:predicted transcriptional regulator
MYLSVLQLLSKSSLKKTHIIYISNVSWNVGTEMINNLFERKLIAPEKPKSRKYMITEKGLQVLEYNLRVTQGLEGNSSLKEDKQIESAKGYSIPTCFVTDYVQDVLSESSKH